MADIVRERVRELAANGPPLECPTRDGAIKCGPILRLIASHEPHAKHNYRASAMIVIEGNSKPKMTYKLGEGLGGEFPATNFHSEDGFYFWRFDIQLDLTDAEQTCEYWINDEREPWYKFYLPSIKQDFNVVSYSCNGFSLATDTSSFKGSLWLDVLEKHSVTKYHVMIGGGDQLYCDAIKLSSDAFKGWVETKDPLKKRHAKLTPEMEASFHKFYLSQYMQWYAHGFWKGTQSTTLQVGFPVALATIPSTNIYDDHDIIDGFGSYSDSLMRNEVFGGVGKVAFKYYMLFQHQVSVDNDVEAFVNDKSWILGPKPGPYMQQKSHSTFTRMGPTMAYLGLDCRTERYLKQVVTEETYNAVFDRLEREIRESKFDHLLVLLGVPIAYTRLVWLEWLFTSKLFAPVKWLSRAGVVAKGLVNDFNGEVELLDDLNDHWCAMHHKKERNYLVARLQDYGAKHGVRVTILSGDVHLAAVGRFKSKEHNHLIMDEETEQKNYEVHENPQNDVRLMFNVVSSAIVNTPPPDAMPTLLQRRSTTHHFDWETDEDMVPLFRHDVNGEKRNDDCFLNRRNWADILPVETILHNEQLQQKYQLELGEKRYPGQTGMHPQKFDGKYNPKGLVYPVTDRAVVVTLHMEKDRTDPESETIDYDFVIPELARTVEKLSHKNLKHLTSKKFF